MYGFNFKCFGSPESSCCAMCMSDIIFIYNNTICYYACYTWHFEVKGRGQNCSKMPTTLVSEDLESLNSEYKSCTKKIKNQGDGYTFFSWKSQMELPILMFVKFASFVCCFGWIVARFIFIPNNVAGYWRNLGGTGES